MKRIFLYIVTTVLLVAGFTSCGEDFLKIPQTDIVSPEVLLTSQEYIEEGLNGIYDLFYAEKASGSSDLQSNWNLKPQLAFCNYPTLDLQPSGWDIAFTRHEWKSDYYMFGDAWKRAYNAIDRANRFLANLEKADLAVFDNGETTKKIIESEARAIRAYFYTFLCQNWGGVPMLLTGDTYSSTPNKPRGTAEEAWNMIIADLEYAGNNIDWDPWKGNTGRITKGMIKSFLAQAYMYNKRFADAKKELKDVIDCQRYSLNPCFAYIHIAGKVWQKESVWEIAYPKWSNMGWGAESSTDAVWWPAQMTASGEWGGWGPAHTSYEFVWSFEPGDKRLQYSVIQYGDVHPCYRAQIGSSDGWNQPFVTGEILPNNFLLKFWKEAPDVPYCAMPITQLRLAGVMLNYAECCFETNDMAEGWKYVKLIRDRAWGRYEPQATYETYHPVTLNTDSNVEAPDAETYYSQYKRTGGRSGGMVNVFKGWMKNQAGTADSTFNFKGRDRKVGMYGREYRSVPYDYKPYTIPVWKVALIMERRHEFFGEYSFWQDLCRMGVAGDYLDAEYPKNSIVQSSDNIHTVRSFDFNPNRMLYPIPRLEMETNQALKPEDQNPGYN
jgi:hypothetical protein